MFYWLMVTLIVSSAILIIFHMVNGYFSIKQMMKYKLNNESPQQDISVLVPCYNEESTITSSIQSIQNIKSKYKELEYIFINDGSTDETLERLKDELDLIEIKRDCDNIIPHQPVKALYESLKYPNVFVVDKYNGGKADALNAGINFAANELVVTLDADTLLDKNALPIVNDVFKDENVIAGGGIVNILQGGEYSSGKLQLKRRKMIIRLQIMDYLKGFIVLKSSLSRFNALSVVSGAFGIFRKSLLNEIGGYRVTVGEDMDITLKLQLYAMENKGKRIVFIPQAVAYTECPQTWKDLFSQRIRWHKAYLDCLFVYFGALMKRFFKGGLPFFFFLDTTIIGVIFTMFNLFHLSYVAISEFSIRSFEVILIYLLAVTAISVTNNFLALYLYKKVGGRLKEKNLFSLIVTIIGDIVIFRLFIALFMVLGTIYYFTNKNKWNTVSRTGKVYYSKGA